MTYSDLEKRFGELGAYLRSRFERAEKNAQDSLEHEVTLLNDRIRSLQQQIDDLKRDRE